jgi:aspartyl-tRNA(Asn)/glutamyl-tRNA(Gln) amidotransferase subunit A
VEDCAVTLGVIAGHDPKDPYTWNVPVPDYRAALSGDVRGMKIGLVKELLDPGVLGVTEQVRKAVIEAVQLLASLGAEVDEVSLPLAPLAGIASRTISSVERTSLRPEWLRERPQDFHHNTRVAFMTGQLIPSQTYYKAQKLRAMIRRQTLEALDRYDILAMPTGSEPATVLDLRPGVRSKKQAGRALRDGAYRGLFSMVGGPALSLCCGFTSDGDGKLPLALQLAGRPFDEATVLKVAHAYQSSTTWHLSRPPV